MKKILVLLVACLSFATAAHAKSFTFSYTSDPSFVVSGSFDGTVNGDLVTDLTAIKVFLNGVAFLNNGSLIIKSRNSYGQMAVGGAVASFSGLQNNFGFFGAQGPLPGIIAELFQSVSYSSATYYNASNGNGGLFYNYDNTGTWKLTSVSAVPEPETYAMLLAGFGLMGFMIRRRKNEEA